MVKEHIIPACVDYQNKLVKLLERKKAVEALKPRLKNILLGEFQN